MQMDLNTLCDAVDNNALPTLRQIVGALSVTIYMCAPSGAAKPADAVVTISVTCKRAPQKNGPIICCHKCFLLCCSAVIRGEL